MSMDKRIMILMALQHPVHGKKIDADIARLCKVSRVYVGMIRKELERKVTPIREEEGEAAAAVATRAIKVEDIKPAHKRLPIKEVKKALAQLQDLLSYTKQYQDGHLAAGLAEIIRILTI